MHPVRGPHTKTAGSRSYRGLSIAPARPMRVFLFALAVSGCTGFVESGGGIGGDSSATDAPGSSVDAAVDSSGAACRAQITNVGSGNHHPGMNCMDGCHNHGFTLAGTLFAPGTTTPVVGATITVVDAANVSFDMVTQRNGNFYTSTRVTFPVAVAATSCPDLVHMAGQVTAGNGGCNAQGCHATGGQGAIHLP